MQSSSWPPEHSAALRQHVARGMSYADAADAINAQFGTAYTRNAALGRGKRMGLAHPALSQDRAKLAPRSPRPPKAKRRAKSKKPGERRATNVPPSPPPPAAEPMKLRCVGIRPRLIAFIDLEANDCRYPYGGDSEGEAIAFCGHPRVGGSSYCAPHFHLTRGPAIESERPAGPVLRLVEAA